MYGVQAMTAHMLQALDAHMRAKREKAAALKQSASPVEPLLRAS
jgi:hypothetical protein